MSSFLTKRYEVSIIRHTLPINVVDYILSYLPLTKQAKISKRHQKISERKAAMIILSYVNDWVITRSKSCFPLCAEFDLQFPCIQCITKFTPMCDRVIMRESMVDSLVRDWLDDVFTLIDYISEEEFDSRVGYVNIENEEFIINKYTIELVRQIWTSTSYVRNEVNLIDTFVQLDAKFVFDMIQHIELDIYHNAMFGYYEQKDTVKMLRNTAVHILILSSNMCFDECKRMVNRWDWSTLVDECIVVNYRRGTNIIQILNQ